MKNLVTIPEVVDLVTLCVCVCVSLYRITNVRVWDIGQKDTT